MNRNCSGRFGVGGQISAQWKKELFGPIKSLCSREHIHRDFQECYPGEHVGPDALCCPCQLKGPIQLQEGLPGVSHALPQGSLSLEQELTTNYTQ